MYPGLVSCPFYAIPIYPFKFMKFFIYLLYIQQDGPLFRKPIDSCPFYAIPIYPFKFMKFFIYLLYIQQDGPLFRKPIDSVSS